MKDENLMVGFDTSDDACVYKITDDVAAIETVDFFPPMVDDPYTFGLVAAANSLSDVYAMGGVPKLAMNLLCVPNCLPVEVVGEILRGGADKAIEAGCVIAGGHSIEDNEPKYGMCVTGFVHPDKILRNQGALENDVIVITKPIGSGILATAGKAELLNEKDTKELNYYMALLNKKGAESLEGLEVHACTDITGFGLLGHCGEMMEKSDCAIVLEADKIPYFDRVEEFARMGIIPAGAYRNRDYMAGRFSCEGVDTWKVDAISDPQTSGGLLLSMPEKDAKIYLERMEGEVAAIVGFVEKKKDVSVRII